MSIYKTLKTRTMVRARLTRVANSKIQSLISRFKANKDKKRQCRSQFMWRLATTNSTGLKLKIRATKSQNSRNRNTSRATIRMKTKEMNYNSSQKTGRIISNNSKKHRTDLKYRRENWIPGRHRTSKTSSRASLMAVSITWKTKSKQSRL